MTRRRGPWLHSPRPEGQPPARLTRRKTRRAFARGGENRADLRQQEVLDIEVLNTEARERETPVYAYREDRTERRPRIDPRPLFFLAGVLSLLVLSHIGIRAGAESSRTSEIYYVPVFNPSGDSIAYLKRRARFATSPSHFGLAPSYTFEGDQLQLCVLSLSGGDEDCLSPWALPNQKSFNRSGVLEPTLLWRSGRIDFDIRLRDFVWSSEPTENSVDVARKGPSESPLGPVIPALWYRVEGAVWWDGVRGGPHPTEARSLASWVQSPMAQSPMAQDGSPGPVQFLPGREEAGPSVQNGQIVRATPALEGKSVLRSNRLQITQVGTRQSSGLEPYALFAPHRVDRSSPIGGLDRVWRRMLPSTIAPAPVDTTLQKPVSRVP